MFNIKISPKNRQRGAVALITVVLLALGLGIITLSTNNISMLEQRITGNDIRAREAQEAAEAGLEYATAWAGKKKITWPSGSNDLTCTMSGSTTTCSGTTCDGKNCPILQTAFKTTTSENYNLSVTYSKVPNSNIIKVRSISNTTDIGANVESYIDLTKTTTFNARNPPPLVLDGCMTDTTGTPDIFPVWTDLDGDGTKDSNEWIDNNSNNIVDTGEWTDTNSNGKIDNEMGQSILTSQPETSGTTFCLDYCGPGGSCDADGVAEGHPHMDLHNGTLGNNAEFPDDSLWKYYFDITPQEFKSVASSTLATNTGGLYWITSNGNWGGGTYGTKTNPAIIVFENDCPKPTGGTVIYGILFFFENDGCSMNGWGNVTVYGSIGINGDLKKVNANLKIHGIGDDDSTILAIDTDPVFANRIPGTWKDW